MSPKELSIELYDELTSYAKTMQCEQFFEMKPYLQQFEKHLAIRELEILSDSQLVKTDLPNIFGTLGTLHSWQIDSLAYWQRCGVTRLVPTRQALCELSQNIVSSKRSNGGLHNSRRLRYGYHNLHEYRGKFFPQLVKSLINISGAPKGGVLFDPFCGSGTTVVEGLAAGMNSIGCDLNPLSILITEAKSSLFSLSYEQILKSINSFSALIFEIAPVEAQWCDRDTKYLSDWFAKDALIDVQSILYQISCLDKKVQMFVRVCFSDVIRTISYQKVADLRVRKEVKDYSKFDAQKLLLEKITSQLAQIKAYQDIVPTIESVSPEVIHGDTKKVVEYAPSYKGNVDLIITSPPYATALPYLDTDRLSLISLGLLPRKDHKIYENLMIGTREITEKKRREQWECYLDNKHKLTDKINSLINDIAAINHGEGIGFRRRNLPTLLGMYFLNMLEAFESARTMMKSGGKAYYVVGNNSTNLAGEKLEIPTDRLLFDLAERAGWEKVGYVSMELLTSRDIFKDNRGSSESILELVNP